MPLAGLAGLQGSFHRALGLVAPLRRAGVLAAAVADAGAQRLGVAELRVDGQHLVERLLGLVPALLVDEHRRPDVLALQARALPRAGLALGQAAAGLGEGVLDL